MVEDPWDLIACGWQEVRAAPATFILKDMQGKLCGVMVLHVDDGLVAGKGLHFEESLKQLKARAPSKTWKNQGIKFTGRSVVQNPRTFEITISQAGYFDEVEPIAARGALDGS